RQVVVQVGNVETVDVVAVLGDRGAAERRQVAERLVALHGSRGGRGNVADIAWDRQGVELVRVETGARLDRCHVDGGECVGRDGDRVQGLRAGVRSRGRRSEG